MESPKNPIDISGALDLIRRGHIEFQQAAETLLEQKKSYSYLLQPMFQEYLSATFPDSHDHSLVIRAGRFVVAYAAIRTFIESNSATLLVSMTPRGDGLPLPIFSENLSDKQIRLLSKVITDEIVQIARMNTCEQISLCFHSSMLDASSKDFYDNFGTRHLRIRPRVEYETIIDLTKDISELKAAIRHSYKSIINKGLRCYTFDHFDKDTISDSHLHLHRKLHFIASGRHTRSFESFQSMHEMVKNGLGFFHIQSLDGAPVQTLYTILGKQTAYGGSLGQDTTIELTVPPTHSLNWEMLRYLKENQVGRYHTATTNLWGYYDPEDQSLSAEELKQMRKLEELALFKSGFGGVLSPIFTYKKLIKLDRH